MENWAEFQPAEYLEATRQSFLLKEYAPVIASCCGISDGKNILEVGCGTGAFSHYLAGSTKNVNFYGIDNNSYLLEYFIPKDKDRNGNQFFSTLGDALELPYEDEFFDGVMSHTFLSCVSNPEQAMSEMRRVCKKNGIIASVTAMSWTMECQEEGNYPKEDKGWIRRYKELYRLMYEAYHIQFHHMSMAKGVPLEKIPLFFRKSGVREVSIFPVGRAFSLSDCRLNREEKIRYIFSYYKGEYKKVTFLRNYIEKNPIISETVITEFLELLNYWKFFWLNHLEDNDIWEWNGGTQLLVYGKNG